MVAGEASGDLLAGLLLDGLLRRWPSLRAGGIGGPKMAVPMRSRVAPCRTASSASAVIPIESSGSGRPLAWRSRSLSCRSVAN